MSKNYAFALLYFLLATSKTQFKLFLVDFLKQNFQWRNFSSFLSDQRKTQMAIIDQTERIKLYFRAEMVLVRKKNQRTWQRWWQSNSVLSKQAGFEPLDKLRLFSVQNCSAPILTEYRAFSYNMLKNGAYSSFFFPVSNHHLPIRC